MFSRTKYAVTISAKNFPKLFEINELLYSYNVVCNVVRDDYLTRENVTVLKEKFIRRNTLLAKIMVRIYMCL